MWPELNNRVQVIHKKTTAGCHHPPWRNRAWVPTDPVGSGDPIRGGRTAVTTPHHPHSPKNLPKPPETPIPSGHPSPPLHSSTSTSRRRRRRRRRFPVPAPLADLKVSSAQPPRLSPTPHPHRSPTLFFALLFLIPVPSVPSFPVRVREGREGKEAKKELLSSRRGVFFSRSSKTVRAILLVPRRGPRPLPLRRYERSRGEDGARLYCCLCFQLLVAAAAPAFLPLFLKNPSLLRPLPLLPLPSPCARLPSPSSPPSTPDPFALYSPADRSAAQEGILLGRPLRSPPAASFPAGVSAPAPGLVVSSFRAGGITQILCAARARGLAPGREVSLFCLFVPCRGLARCGSSGTTRT